MLQKYYENEQMDAVMLGIKIADSDLVFSTIDGKPLRPNTITRAWQILATRAGVKVIRLHDARHTHVSIMLKQGVHPNIVQERPEHSTIAIIAITLDTYSHITLGLQEAAVQHFDDLVKAPVKNY